MDCARGNGTRRDTGVEGCGRRHRHSSWPAVSNLARASLQAGIVAETGLLYASALCLERRSRRGEEKAMHREKKQRKCGERGGEDDSDNGESDDKGVAGQGSGVRAQSPGAAGRSGGVSLGDGNDAALGNAKDAASDGE